MTDQQIKYFLTLVEEQSFSKASKKLSVTQPSFSQYIQKMEKQIGARLFDRSSVPIRLTKEGEAVYNAVCQINTIHQNLKQQISSLRNLETGSIQIGITPFRGSTLLANSIQRFHNTYPGIQINIMERQMEELQVKLISGDCDLVISSGNVNANLLHCETLAKERLYLALSKHNPMNEQLTAYQLQESDIIHHSLNLLKVPAINLDFFNKEPYISYEGNDNICEIIAKIFEHSLKKPQVFMKLHNMYTIFSFVVANLGFSIIPDTYIRYGNLKNHPVYYSLDSSLCTNDICLITKKNQTLTPAAYEYCRILKELIVSGTWGH